MFSLYDIYKQDFYLSTNLQADENKAIYLSWISAKLSLDVINKIIALERDIQEIKQQLKNNE